MALSILFGTTLERDCEALAEVAGLLAQRIGAQLRLVHVSEDSRAPFVLGTDEEHILGPVRTRLDEEAERIRRSTGADVHPHLAAGNVVEALVSVARFELALALVLGGPAVLGTALLGNTPERAARQSSVPVLALRRVERLLPWLRGERPLRVLVGADLGRTSEAARAFAAALRSAGPVDIQVVMIASPDRVHAELGLPAPESEHALSAEAEATLVRDLGRAAPAAEGEVDIRVVAARGSADAHLASLADAEDVDLVVVGQRRNSLVEQLWYGSVARGVLRASPVSVACVPPPLPAPRPTFRELRTVLAATDLTESGDAAVAQALGLVTEQGTVHVAHVVAVTGTELEVRRAREQAWHTLARSVGDVPARARRVERHVLAGSPDEQLLALAKRLGADLIVIGTRRRGFVPGGTLGSVARAVSEGTTVPVLLVPGADP